MTTCAAPPSHVSSRTQPERALTTRGFVALCLAGVLGPFAFTSMTTTTAALARDLHVTPNAAALVLVAYGAAFAALLLVGGRLGDAWGRRRMLRVGLTLMLAASVVVAAAPSLTVVVGARVAQGMASALFFPQLLAIIQAGAEPPRRLAMIARYTAALSLGTTGGQMVGGALVAVDVAGLGWRVVPLLSAGGALVALVAASWVSAPTPSGDRVDGVGAGLLVLGLGALLSGIALLASRGLDVASGVLAVVGVAALRALVGAERRREGRGRSVVVSVHALRVPAVGLGAAAVVVFYTAFTGFLVIWSAFGVRTAGPGAASMSFVVPGVVFLVVSLFLHRIVGVLGSRTPLVGAAVQGIGLVVLAVMLLLGAPGGLWALVPAATVMTAGNALMYGPLMPVVMNGVPTADAGMASGVFATAQQIAMALGSAVFAALWRSVDGPAAPTRAFAMAVVTFLAAGVVFAGLAWRLVRGARRSHRETRISTGETAKRRLDIFVVRMRTTRR